MSTEDAALPAIDAGPDSMQLAIACPQDPALVICLSFDAPALTSPYANEGALAVAANLTMVSRTQAGGGGAALLASTSEILIPASSQIAGIAAIDARVRLDEDVPTGGRIGIIDADNANPGMSLFIYAGTTTTHRIRCNLGGVDLYANTSIALGTYTEIGCTCIMNNVAVHRDGVKLVELAGTTTCSGGSAGTSGLQIGQNSRAAQSLPPNEPLVGAIDRVRVWTSVPQ